MEVLHKVRFLYYANGNSNTYTQGNSGENRTTMTLIRIEIHKMNDQDWLNLALASMHSGQW